MRYGGLTRKQILQVFIDRAAPTLKGQGRPQVMKGKERQTFGVSQWWCSFNTLKYSTIWKPTIGTPHIWKHLRYEVSVVLGMKSEITHTFDPLRVGCYHRRFCVRCCNFELRVENPIWQNLTLHVKLPDLISPPLFPWFAFQNAAIWN